MAGPHHFVGVRPRRGKLGVLMGRFMDKWGLWIALVVVGSIIAYGVISGYMRESEPTGKGAAAPTAPGPSLKTE